MFKSFKFLFLVSFLFVCGNAGAVILQTKKSPQVEVTGLDFYGMTETSIRGEEFLTLTTADIEGKIGKKMSWKQKASFKMMQLEVKRQMKHAPDDVVVNAKNHRFSLGGFLLGFFFWVIGILIAILFGGNAFRSAIYGFLISFGIFVALFFLTKN